MEDKWDTLHSLRVRPAAGHHMHGTAMDVLTEYIGWRPAAIAGRNASDGISGVIKRN